MIGGDTEQGTQAINQCKISWRLQFVCSFGWLVGCVLRPIHSKVIKRRQPLAKEVKLGFYTIPTGNRTPCCRMAVHYTTAAPRQLHE